MINPLFFMFFPRDRRSPRPPRRCPWNRVPGLVLLQAEPGRLNAFPGRLVEGAHHAGLWCHWSWGDELPLGDGDVNGWMGNLGIWIIVISTFVLGGELEDFHISYLKVDIFMDELFTWIQVSIGDEHRWTIFIGFIGMIFTSHHITTSGNGTHFSGIIYSHSSWPGAKAAKCTVKTAISVGMAGNHHENSCPVAGPRHQSHQSTLISVAWGAGKHGWPARNVRFEKLRRCKFFDCKLCLSTGVWGASIFGSNPCLKASPITRDELQISLPGGFSHWFYHISRQIWDTKVNHGEPDKSTLSCPLCKFYSLDISIQLGQPARNKSRMGFFLKTA